MIQYSRCPVNGVQNKGLAFAPQTSVYESEEEENKNIQIEIFSQEGIG